MTVVILKAFKLFFCVYTFNNCFSCRQTGLGIVLPFPLEDNDKIDNMRQYMPLPDCSSVKRADLKRSLFFSFTHLKKNVIAMKHVANQFQKQLKQILKHHQLAKILSGVHTQTERIQGPYIFTYHSFPMLEFISVPNRQNTVQLIFGKNELGAFSESLRPPLSIACPTMAMAGL